MGTVGVSTNMYWRRVSQRRTPVGGNNRKRKSFALKVADEGRSKTKKVKVKKLKKKNGKGKVEAGCQ